MAWYLPTRSPLFWAEMRRRFRGGRAFLLLFGYNLILLSVLIGAVILIGIGQSPQEWGEFAGKLWTSFLWGQILIVLLMGPGLTASIISAEREHSTLDLLFLTPVGSWSLVSGKFLGAIGQLLLLVVSSLPIIAIVFIYGSVSPWELILGYALLVSTGLFYAALGLLASCLFARTTLAVAWAYGFLLLVLVVLPVASMLLALLAFSAGMSDTVMLFWANPVLLTVMLGDPANSPWDTGQGILIMAVEAVVLLLICTGLVARLRGMPLWSHRRLPLAVARHLSRPTARE